MLAVLLQRPRPARSARSHSRSAASPACACSSGPRAFPARLRPDAVLYGAWANGDVRAAWSYNPGGLLLFAIVVAQIPLRMLQISRIHRGLPEIRLGSLIPSSVCGARCDAVRSVAAANVRRDVLSCEKVNGRTLKNSSLISSPPSTSLSGWFWSVCTRCAGPCPALCRT